MSDSISDSKHKSEEQLEFSSSVNAYDKIDIAEQSSDDESSNDEQSSGQQSSDDEQSISHKEDKKKVSAAKPTPVSAAKTTPVSAAKPTPVSAAKPKPVSLRELMKTKPSEKREEITEEKINDWLTVDDI